MDKNPTEHVGLLYVNNRTVAPATRFILRNNKRYYTARGALGFLDDGGIDIAWNHVKKWFGHYYWFIHYWCSRINYHYRFET